MSCGSRFWLDGTAALGHPLKQVFPRGFAGRGVWRGIRSISRLFEFEAQVVAGNRDILVTIVQRSTGKQFSLVLDFSNRSGIDRQVPDLRGAIHGRCDDALAGWRK